MISFHEDRFDIEAFMQAYFSERAELHRIWVEKFASFRQSVFAPDYLAALYEGWSEDDTYAREHPPVVQEINVQGAEAVLITLEPEYKKQNRYRYHLRCTVAGWQIACKGSPCHSCQGTGRRKNGKCKDCKGLGWDCDEEASS